MNKGEERNLYEFEYASSDSKHCEMPEMKDFNALRDALCLKGLDCTFLLASHLRAANFGELYVAHL